MVKCIKTALILFLSIVILIYIIGCTQTQSDNVPEPLPWIEHNDIGLFETTDLARAQDEIPFDIIVPTYIPDERNSAPLPSIRGPLREFQSSGKIIVEILYIVDIGHEENSGLIKITEQDRPIESEDSKSKIVEIKGKRVVKWEGNFSLGPGFFFFFDDSGIYYVVEVYYFSYDEAIKIVESMIK
jgi:hypothetical protein